MTKKTIYRQRLMHIQPKGFTFFVTFRLAGSIPKNVTRELSIQYENGCDQVRRLNDDKERNLKLYNLRKKLIFQYDSYLDKNRNDNICNLTNPEIVGHLKEQLSRYDGQLYTLLCYTIMSNHVHLLIDTSIQLSEENPGGETYVQLDEIMKRIKGASARYINIELGRKGPLWQKESYDIYIRNQKMLENVTSYILENPVKAGIVDDWMDYNHSYLKI